MRNISLHQSTRHCISILIASWPRGREKSDVMSFLANDNREFNLSAGQCLELYKKEKYTDILVGIMLSN